jgi:hypothetical protein
MLSEGLPFGALCLLSLLIVVAAAIYRALRRPKPRQPETPVERLVAIPSLRSVVVMVIIVVVVSALFFTWLGYQWHHGPAP